MENKLTNEEVVYYSSFGLIDLCDSCHGYFPMHNYNDGKNYLTWTGKNLYCQKCMADSSNGKTRVS